MPRALLFDLDGTLVDSAPDIADALNQTLSLLGRPQVAEARVRGWIGDGGRALLAKALEDDAMAAVAWPTFEITYEALCGRRSRVHDGVPQMLARWRSAGAALAVLTNKERRFTLKLLGALGLDDAFDVVVAGDTLAVKKPDPRVAQHALSLLGVAAADALLVGDSVVDVRCGRAAGLRVWLVRHGYPAGEFIGADAPDAFIEHFDQFVPWGPISR